MYSGLVKGIGPRYCPSIEDKVVKFSDKPQHQIFLEPESKEMNSIYVQGFSTSMPHDIQEQMIRTLPGLENCTILKYAYAIEYDCINPNQLNMMRLIHYNYGHHLKPKSLKTYLLLDKSMEQVVMKKLLDKV